MPVVVRNTKTGPSVFSIPEEKVEIVWGGAGDPTGEDVQEVPDAVASKTAFRKAVQRGIFVVVTQEEADASFDAQAEAARTKDADAATRAKTSIDMAANNDLLSFPCQGPDGRGNGLCGNPVPVRESERGSAPVLCPQHTGLAGEFIEVETDKMIDKGDRLESEKIWVRPTLAERETR